MRVSHDKESKQVSPQLTKKESKHSAGALEDTAPADNKIANTKEIVPTLGPCIGSAEELISKIDRLEGMLMHLEKSIGMLGIMPLCTDTMAYKITRTVVIGGKQHWIRANTEQEYADKLLKLFAGNSTPAAVSADKHDFATYAMRWFEIYSRPTVATATASTYERQLKKIILPHFEGIAVEDITVDHVQLLFNGMGGAKSSKDKTKTVLGMVLDMAVEDGLLQRNPLKSKRLKVSGASSQTRKPYTVEEMQYIVGHLGQVQSPSDRNFLP